MPAFIHNRAEHILARNPSMPKSEAFAIATQQSHALGKTPKGYGTAEGKREARAKFDTPKDDVKAANPGHLESSKMATSPVDDMAHVEYEMFLDEFKKDPAAAKKRFGSVSKLRRDMGIPRSWKHTPFESKKTASHGLELAGLGLLAVPSIDKIQAKLRGGENKKLMGEGTHSALDLAGLGTLAIPAARALMKHAFFDELSRIEVVKQAGVTEMLKRVSGKMFGKRTLHRTSKSNPFSKTIKGNHPLHRMKSLRALVHAKTAGIGGAPALMPAGLRNIGQAVAGAAKKGPINYMPKPHVGSAMPLPAMRAGLQSPNPMARQTALGFV